MNQMNIPNVDRLTLRWTIGNVHDRGFEMLRLSIGCAFRLFGSAATYVVCVNSLPSAEVRQRTGPLPALVQWIEVTRRDLPGFLKESFDERMIEGMGWKLAPLRINPEDYELSIDNDCILWGLPEGMSQWLRSTDGCLIAEDVERCLGRFDRLCPPGKFNAGIRGLVPGVDLREALRFVLAQVRFQSRKSFRLFEEIDEQGLQVAAICSLQPLFLVRADEVSLCSPFWPRSPKFGKCGAHLIGMNTRHLSWNYYDRPADLWLEEHWQSVRSSLYRIAKLPLSSSR